MTLPTPLAQLLRRFRAVLARWRRRGWFLLSTAVSFPGDVLARLRHRRQVRRNRLPSPPAPPVRLRLEQFESIVPLNDMLGTGLTALGGAGLLTPGILSPAPPAPPVTGEAPLGSGLGLPTDDTPSDTLPTLATPIATDPVTIPGGEAATGDGTPSTNPAPDSFTAPVTADALFQNPGAMSVLAGSGGDDVTHSGAARNSGSANNSSMAGAGSGSPVTPSVRVNTALGMGGAGAATAGGGGMPGAGALIQTASSASAQDAGAAATGTAAAGTPPAGTSTATATGSNGPAPGTAPAATSTAPQTPASSSAPSTPSVPQVPAVAQPHLPSMP